MKTFTAAQLSILWITLRYSYAVSPIDCNATELLAGKALDLINKGRSNGYLFQLLRVADAHLDKAESTDVYYLVLDVKESDCPVQSRKHWDDCEPNISRYLFDTVIGQCKVIATTRLSEFQDLRVNDFNCTTSSVFSALANTKDSPVLLDFFEETEVYRKQADKVLEMYKKENGDFASFRVDQVERVGRGRGGRRTNYYIDFSVRNCSSHHFHRHYNVFGFCRSVLSYDVGASDLETPIEVDTNCEVFDLKEHRNISDVQPHLDHLLHSGGHGHSSGGKPPFTHSRSRDNLHHHKPHKPGCPPPMDDKNHSERPPLQAGASLRLPPSRCHHLHFHINDTHAPHHNNHSSSEHQSYGHHPHDHHHHGHQPHRHHHHGHHPHGHHPHGQHPDGHGFHDHGPCDTPPHRQGPQDHHHRGHGPPHRHSEERGPGKGHFPLKWRQIGYVYRLPPLKKGEVLPPPEANFPSFSLPNHNYLLKPKIQPFPESASELCPGMFNSEFSHVSKFFGDISRKKSEILEK